MQPTNFFVAHVDPVRKEIVTLLEKPFSGLVIASGRTTVFSSGNSTCSIQIQQPHCSVRLFDAVVSPIHDARSHNHNTIDTLWRLNDNQLYTIGSLHDVVKFEEEATSSSLRHLCKLLPQPQQTADLPGC
eukprot:525212-Hanusia_phi.AAC.7